MELKKYFCLVALVSVCLSLGFGQTLAEIAKKERERRESLKGKKGIVVTNAELAKLKKKPALEIPSGESQAEPEQPPVAASSNPTSPETLLLPEAGEPATLPPPAESASQSSTDANLIALQERWEKAKEYVELLTLKMGALWQQFSNVDNPGAKEAIQLAISETFIKLQNAQEEEDKARQELERYLGQVKKESTPSLWIR